MRRCPHPPLPIICSFAADVRSPVLLRFVDPALLRESDGEFDAALDLFETRADAVPVPCSAEMHQTTILCFCVYDSGLC